MRCLLKSFLWVHSHQREWDPLIHLSDKKLRQVSSHISVEKVLKFGCKLKCGVQVTFEIDFSDLSQDILFIYHVVLNRIAIHCEGSVLRKYHFKRWQNDIYNSINYCHVILWWYYKCKKIRLGHSSQTITSYREGKYPDKALLVIIAKYGCPVGQWPLLYHALLRC